MPQPVYQPPLTFPALGPISFCIGYLFVHLCFLSTCSAQTTINGQTYTNGLSIINAPAQKSEHHAGSNLPISIEVSGNGKLPFAALTPGSELASSYELLEIYLVSSQTQLNLTVSSGPDLLAQEKGTVRHLDFSVPSCVPSGQYNLTFYETSFINSVPCFIITPIPISILNSAEPGTSCTDGSNYLQLQPQSSSDYGRPPFDPNQQIVISTGALVRGVPATQTRSSGSPTADMPIATSTSPNGASSPTPQPDGSPRPLGSVTLVIVSQVITTSTNAQGKPITTSYMTTRTTTAPMNTQDSTGFIPINAGTAPLNQLTYTLIIILLASRIITFALRAD